jgi:hypothetical protein
MHPQRVESLSHAQRERLAYIDFRLYFFGEIGRPDLIDRFGVAPAGATRDLALYREVAPQNITFDGSNKIYRIGQAFEPLFEHAPQRVLSALALGFGDGVNGATQPLLPCESPTALSNPRMDVLAPVCRAIHGKRPVAIRYHSMSSGESERVSDHTELFKQFSDNPSFKRWLTDMVFDSTYHPGAVPPKAPPQTGGRREGQ